MDNQLLTQALRDFLPSDYQWKFATYKTKKSRDGFELEFFGCKVTSIAPWIDQLREMLLTKQLAQRVVMPYTPLLSLKENISSLIETDEYIAQSLSDLLDGLKNMHVYAPEDFSSGMLPTMTGYVFYGVQQHDPEETPHEILLLRRTNPMMNNLNIALYTPQSDHLIQDYNPVFKFSKGIDLLYIDGICYFFSDAGTKDFGLEARHIAICAKRMELIAQSNLVNHYDQFESVAMNHKNSKKFMDFDEEILKYINTLSPLDRGEFLDKHGIVLDEQGRMDTYDPDQCELIIDLLCCRSCHDALGRLSVGSHIVPR